MFSLIFDLILFVSLFRSTGKRFDVAYGARGCLASGVCMLLTLWAIIIPVDLLGLNEWLSPFSINHSVNYTILFLLTCLLVLCFGGYHAARLGRTTGWTNSLVVGMFAESFLLARLLDELTKPDLGYAIVASQQMQVMFEKPWGYWGRLPGRLFDQLIEMLQEHPVAYQASQLRESTAEPFRRPWSQT